MLRGELQRFAISFFVVTGAGNKVNSDSAGTPIRSAIVSFSVRTADWSIKRLSASGSVLTRTERTSLMARITFDFLCVLFSFDCWLDEAFAVEELAATFGAYPK